MREVFQILNSLEKASPGGTLSVDEVFPGAAGTGRYIGWRWQSDRTGAGSFAYLGPDSLAVVRGELPRPASGLGFVGYVAWELRDVTPRYVANVASGTMPAPTLGWAPGTYTFVRTSDMRAFRVTFREDGTLTAPRGMFDSGSTYDSWYDGKKAGQPTIAITGHGPAGGFVEYLYQPSVGKLYLRPASQPRKSTPEWTAVRNR